MPSLKAIRRRIASVKNTQKITRAMKLVAAARLRRAQQRILELRPYANKTAEVLASVASRASDKDDALHPLLARREEVKTAVIVVYTSDRGLAGAYNANILRLVDRHIRELTARGVPTVQVVTIGRKGRDYFRRRGVEVLHDFAGVYESGSKRTAEIARQLIDDFESGRVDEIFVAYTEFKSAITQRPLVDPLIPVQPRTATPPANETERGIVPDEGTSTTGAPRGDFIYEPDKAALLERLLPMYVEIVLYRAMLESAASEHGARMTAMDNATKNAKEMIGSLTLQYNRARQAAITKELMEIIGGAEALKD
jgi:F-type H+-transporting ATPase subunit gamma